MFINIKFQIETEYSVSESVALNRVRFSLIGYNGQISFLDAIPYSGLMKKEEYDYLVSKKKVEIGFSNGKKYGSKGAKTQIEQKIGIHAQTHEDHKLLGKMGAESCGFTIWSDEEKALAISLSRKCEYKRGSRYNAKKIASELNLVFHECNDIRNSNAIQRFLADYKKGLRK